MTVTSISGSSGSESDEDISADMSIGSLNSRDVKHIDRLYVAMRICVVISVILIVISLAFIGLAQARYVHPLLALYAFSGSCITFVVIKILDICRQRIAEKNHINLKAYDKKSPPSPEPEDKKNKKKKAKA